MLEVENQATVVPYYNPPDMVDQNPTVKRYTIGLEFTPSSTFKDVEKVGNEILTVLKVAREYAPWWVGDYINHVTSQTEKKYEQLLEQGVYEYGTLRNCAYVCRAIPLSERCPSLSFGHHSAVASQPIDKRRLLLSEAEVGHWTLKQLREKIKSGRLIDDKCVPDKVELIKEEEKKAVRSFEGWWEANKEKLMEVTRKEACQMAWEASHGG